MKKTHKQKIVLHSAVIASVMLLGGFAATETIQPKRLQGFSLAPEQRAAKLAGVTKQLSARETAWQHKAQRTAPRTRAETVRTADNLGDKLRQRYANALIPVADTSTAATPHVSAEQHAQVRALNRAHQASGGVAAHFDGRNGTLSHLAVPKRTSVGKELVTQKESAHTVAKKFLTENRALLKMEDPNAEVALKREHTDALGQTHVRFQQTYRGIPLFGKELMVHMDSQREVTLLQGRHEPTPNSININPAFAADAAVSAVFKDLGLGVHKFAAPTTELVIHTPEKGAATLAYKVVTKPALNQHWIHFVDAHSGKVIDKIDNVQGAVVTASGVDLNGQARSFTAWSGNGGFYLIDPTTPATDVAGYDPVAALIAGNPRSDTFIETAKNTEGSGLDFVTSTSLNSWDRAAVSAAYNTRKVYDYYKNTHGRNSLDGKNATLQAVIHFGVNLDNAFWNGTHMVYGDGGTVFNPLAGCLDVAAHEMTHGVIENTAGLLYVNQSGALNESFADVFGAMVDSTNWTVGDGCMKSGPYLRNLANPKLGRSPQPSKMSEYQQLPQTKDNGGVHINSGIPNRAAYLMAEGLSAEGLGTSIGRAHTEKIYYWALTNYLLQSSQFIDARRATIKAAQDLYPADVAAVAKAWDVVQVTDSSNAPAVPTPTDAVAGSDMMIYLSNPVIAPTTNIASFEILIQRMAATFTGYDAANDWGPYTGTPPNAANALNKRPAAITFRDANNRVLTDILYVDNSNNIRLIELDPATMALLSNKNITTTGGFNSIAISSDNRYIAVTTTDVSDNQIHFIDLNSATGDFDITLASENYSSTGAAQNTVLFADTLHFDYAGQYLVFDALNCQALPNNPCTPSSGGYRYWSIGRVDLPNRQLQYLLPGQDPAFDIGNPVFATNNRNIIALDVVDYSDPNNVQHGVFSYDLEQQQPYLVADLKANGFSSGSQPYFWGNDDFITFVKPDATVGKKAYRVPVNSKGAAVGAEVELNPYAATSPIMHRAGVRTLTGGVTLNVSQLDFGAVIQGETKVLQFNLTNSGNSDVSITSLSIDNLQAFNTNLTNGLIPRGTTATFNATFSPSTLGTQTGNLVITTNAKSATVQVALSGVAVTAATPTPVPPPTGGNGGGGGGGGCAVGSEAPFDPVLLLLVAGALVYLRRRKSY